MTMASPSSEMTPHELEEMFRTPRRPFLEKEDDEDVSDQFEDADELGESGMEPAMNSGSTRVSFPFGERKSAVSSHQGVSVGLYCHFAAVDESAGKGTHELDSEKDVLEQNHNADRMQLMVKQLKVEELEGKVGVRDDEIQRQSTEIQQVNAELQMQISSRAEVCQANEYLQRKLEEMERENTVAIQNAEIQIQRLTVELQRLKTEIEIQMSSLAKVNHTNGCLQRELEQKNEVMLLMINQIQQHDIYQRRYCAHHMQQQFPFSEHAAWREMVKSRNQFEAVASSQVHGIGSQVTSQANAASTSYATAEQMATGEDFQCQSQMGREDDRLAKETPSSKQQRNPNKSKLHAEILTKEKSSKKAEQDVERGSYGQSVKEIGKTGTQKQLQLEMREKLVETKKLKMMTKDFFKQIQEMKLLFGTDICPIHSKMEQVVQEIKKLEESVMAKNPSVGRAVHKVVGYAADVMPDSAVYSLPPSQRT